MKAKLIYNLPDDELEYKQANKAASLLSMLWDYKEWLRSELKYKDTPASLEEAQTKFFELLEDESINLNELWT